MAKNEVPGVLCPKCGCNKLETKETRPKTGGKIMRRRECRRCRHRFTTFEVTADSLAEPDFKLMPATFDNDAKRYRKTKPGG